MCRLDRILRFDSRVRDWCNQSRQPFPTFFFYPLPGVSIMVKSRSAVVTVSGVLLTLGLGVATAAEPIGQIDRLQGSALVSQGAQYVPAREGMTLRELDRVLIMEDSNATLAFNDGCVYETGEQTLLTLGPESLCGSADHGSDVLGNAVADAGPGQAGALEQAATGQLGAAGGAAAGFGGAAVVAGAGLVGIAWSASDQGDNNSGDLRRFLSPE
jgi:hypothetical protein